MTFLNINRVQFAWPGSTIVHVEIEQLLGFSRFSSRTGETHIKYGEVHVALSSIASSDLLRLIFERQVEQ